MKKCLKTLGLPILLLALLTVLLLRLPTGEDRKIYDKLIRLHVIANSDSAGDQALKLRVRDAILQQASAAAEGCADRQEAEEALAVRLPELQKTAEAVLRENGCHLPVTVRLGEEHYPTREYEGFRLPAGEYCSLRVMIGEAEGQNWWCVLFPPLCTDKATPSEELISAGFSPEEVRILTDSDSPEYVLRFRILELIGSLFS